MNLEKRKKQAHNYWYEMTTINFRAKNPSLFDTSIFIELLRLMKPRVMSLVIFTCAVGLLTAPGEVSFIKSIINIFFVTLGAGAAGALNMWLSLIHI